NWPLITQRLDFMLPGFLRVVEPASMYFGGYDASGNPRYRWTAPSVQELLSILKYAQDRGIPVVLGDWADPLIGGDSWVTATLQSIPTLIGAYDSHRYATISGIQTGVYGDQVRARRLEISN